MQTRWHELDLSGRLLADEGDVAEGGRWLVIRLPAVADSPDDPLNRQIGDPLPHPLIDPDVRDTQLAHWHDKRRSVTVRDWHALYMADPQAVEGALLSWDDLRAGRIARAQMPPPVKSAVAVDPNGGGRDTYGVIGGVLGPDQRLYITDDRSGSGGSKDWSEAAVRLAVTLDADRIIFEVNYGGDMVERSIRTAWTDLQRAGDIPADRLVPRLEGVRAKKNKVLRAEPIAQAFLSGQIRTVPDAPGALGDLEHEWATWQPTDPDSPGRIDASVYLAWGLLPLPGAENVIGTAANVSRSQVQQQRGPVPGPPGPGSPFGRGGRRFGLPGSR
ncbi:hypothetical protein BJF79_09690 [Actinomadura sp. CNU-125]|nr:hypothetical protein BJF79_09690 [Actinomadura sp. CNU-125]